MFTPHVHLITVIDSTTLTKITKCVPFPSFHTTMATLSPLLYSLMTLTGYVQKIFLRRLSPMLRVNGTNFPPVMQTMLILTILFTKLYPPSLVRVLCNINVLRILLFTSDLLSSIWTMSFEDLTCPWRTEPRRRIPLYSLRIPTKFSSTTITLSRPIPKLQSRLVGGDVPADVMGWSPANSQPYKLQEYFA